MTTNTANSALATMKYKVPAAVTQPITMEESPVPGALYTGANIIGILLFVFLTWASFASVQEIASASGQIIPNGYVQTVQHLEGGIIKEILVEDGQYVEKGQALIKFDNTNADADFGQMKSRQSSLQQQSIRLKKFASGEFDASSLTPEEMIILESMEASRSGQQEVLRDQIAQKENELQGILSARSSIKRNLELASEEFSINKELSKKGSVSKVAVMSSERQVNLLKGDLTASVSQENQAMAAIREYRNRLESLNADLSQDAMTKLGEIEAELAEINKSIVKLEDVSARTTVTAPVSGIAKGLTVHTIGSIIEQGKILLEIVPMNKEMVVEALIQPSDIGNVQEGQNVKVKVTAFDFSKYGTISGHLKSISASTFQNEKGESFYKAKIKLEKNYIGLDTQKNRILPGMVVQADIITGKKTIIEYLLRPVNAAMQTAFNER